MFLFLFALLGKQLINDFTQIGSYDVGTCGRRVEDHPRTRDKRSGTSSLERTSDIPMMSCNQTEICKRDPKYLGYHLIGLRCRFELAYRIRRKLPLEGALQASIRQLRL